MAIFIAYIFFILIKQNSFASKRMSKVRFLWTLVSFEETKILGFNQCHKSDKAPFIIYADLDSLIKNGWMSK